jgi:glycosyltransferase involved in cell wall biosynthesis
MKLALVIPGFQADERDWCIPAFTNLARELAKSADLHVFALRYPHKKGSYGVGAVTVHALGGGSLWGRVRAPAISLLTLWKQAQSAIEVEHRRAPFDALIGIWATESGWLASRMAQRLGALSIVHLAGGELVWLPKIRYGNQGLGLPRLLVSGALKRATLVTVPSAPMERLLFSKPMVRPARVRRWAPGVDTEMFSYRLPDNIDRRRPFTFLTIGSLIPVKNHRGLLLALAEAKRRAPTTRFCLHIAGSGPLRGPLERLAASLGLQGYVIFVGEVPHEQLPDVIAASDCFLLGSYHEAQCMALLEAMACGRPWIAPPVGAAVDCARVPRGDTQSGILVRDQSTSAMARSLLSMMDMRPAAIAQMGFAARRRVESDYELRMQTRKLLDIAGGLTQSGTIDTIPEG